MCGQVLNGTILCCSWFHSHTELNQVSCIWLLTVGSSPSAIVCVMCTVLLINLYMLQFCCLTLSQSVSFLRLVILVVVLFFLNSLLFFHSNLCLLFVLAFFFRKNLWCVRALKAEQHLIHMIFLQRCAHI